MYRYYLLELRNADGEIKVRRVRTDLEIFGIVKSIMYCSNFYEEGWTISIKKWEKGGGEEFGNIYHILGE